MLLKAVRLDSTSTISFERASNFTFSVDQWAYRSRDHDLKIMRFMAIERVVAGGVNVGHPVMLAKVSHLNGTPAKYS